MRTRMPFPGQRPALRSSVTALRPSVTPSLVAACLSCLLALPSCRTTVNDGGTTYMASNEKGESILDARLRKLADEVKLYPKRHDLHYEIAGIHYEKQDLHAAARALERAIELQPTNVQYHTMLGRAYLQMEELDLAERHFRKAVSLVPPGRYSGPHAALGYVLSLKKDCPGAIEEFEKCVVAEPNNPKYWYSLGAQHDIMGNREEAVRYFQQYLQSGDTEYRRHTVFILERLGVSVRATEGRPLPAAATSVSRGENASAEAIPRTAGRPADPDSAPVKPRAPDPTSTDAAPEDAPGVPPNPTYPDEGTDAFPDLPPLPTLWPPAPSPAPGG